ncbi:pantoate--beta-alanine ligase [Dokdonia sp. Hel_I_53]|uniref:pantoate--beta-alanine ligase n=1 Tax=Dokdonia sp. Hel_I_53 TaxID=1566287 RepID=UPI001199ADCA|nr:pantoate--beta-alanine ligase [Dokdonia sp. Hel_I_53]TVZ52441.1 pantothenate synthetase [Dokdonia sp. Hel_I_53]
MQVITAHHKIQTHIQEAKTSGKTIGFVPTMGALHEGHASLVNYASKDCALVVVSIFVNPTQFNNASDLETYPRTLDADVAFLNALSKDIIIYAPSAKEVYGDNISSDEYNFGELENVMEGAHRPGHFDGVGTVLNKLFRQINPDRAYFGEKDFQQLAIVKRLVKKERLSVEIIGCPIYRENNGLAMSSRNARLTPKQLTVAPFIYKTLKEVKKRFHKDSASVLKDFVQRKFSEIESLELEYFEIANAQNLQPLSRKRSETKYRAFLAVYAGEVRLIDNIALN